MTQTLEFKQSFWNFRGVFKLGPVDIGTHSSLVRLKDGTFVLLDACDFAEAQLEKIHALTDKGLLIKAVVFLHPFHTVFTETAERLFPKAQFYGTARHVSKYPNVSWSEVNTEEFELNNPFNGDLRFTTPKGVDFISPNDNIHFGSVLAFHPASKTIHSDDTFNIINLPDSLDPISERLGAKVQIQFHPTLPFALEKTSTAADQFLAWVDNVCAPWFSEAENLCAAHNGVFMSSSKASLAKKLARAKLLIRPAIALHRLRY